MMIEMLMMIRGMLMAIIEKLMMMIRRMLMMMIENRDVDDDDLSEVM